MSCKWAVIQYYLNSIQCRNTSCSFGLCDYYLPRCTSLGSPTGYHYCEWDARLGACSPLSHKLVHSSLLLPYIHLIKFKLRSWVLLLASFMCALKQSFPANEGFLIVHLHDLQCVLYGAIPYTECISITFLTISSVWFLYIMYRNIILIVIQDNNPECLATVPCMHDTAQLSYLTL